MLTGLVAHALTALIAADSDLSNQVKLSALIWPKLFLAIR